jgi:tetratricopeptide (TPR) repeat protein
MMLSNNVMAVLRRRKYVSLFWIPFFLAIFPMCGCNCSQQQQHSSEDYLVLGNNALSEDANARAVDLYKKGIDVAVAAAALNTSDKHKSLVTMVSLETNLATAYSAMEGMEQKAMEHYEKAIQAYSDNQASITAAHSIDDNDNNNNNNNSALLEDAKAIVSQTAFFYGMELQEIDAGRAVEMYGRAVLLDPELWAAWANLGACVCVSCRFVSLCI